MQKSTTEVNARQMKCPMPLLKLKQALNKIESGDIVQLVATDPSSKRDFYSFAELAGHKINLEQSDNEYHYTVVKK